MDIVLHGEVAEMLQDQVVNGGYQSPEEVVYEALHALAKTKIDEGINRGLADVKMGRGTEIRPDNIADIAKSIVARSLEL
jgi:Arc/MetJ-type ribon-helix-helix transcriptional regulator